jgi:ABC-type transport system involved in cytochrome c biogenesis ATPase subunit
MLIHVFKNVCIEANIGEQLIIYGMNGSGKTTVLRNITHFNITYIQNVISSVHLVHNARNTTVMQHIYNSSGNNNSKHRK